MECVSVWTQHTYTHAVMAENMRDPAAGAKARQRGLTVLERQAEEQKTALRLTLAKQEIVNPYQLIILIVVGLPEHTSTSPARAPLREP